MIMPNPLLWVCCAVLCCAMLCCPVLSRPWIPPGAPNKVRAPGPCSEIGKVRISCGHDLPLNSFIKCICTMNTFGRLGGLLCYLLFTVLENETTHYVSLDLNVTSHLGFNRVWLFTVLPLSQSRCNLRCSTGKFQVWWGQQTDPKIWKIVSASSFFLNEKMSVL